MFVPVFAWLSLRSAADVAWRALHPRRPLHPALVDFVWHVEGSHARASALLMLRFLWLTRRVPVPDPGAAPAVGRYPELPWILMLGGVLVLPWITFRDTPMLAAAASGSEQLAAIVPLIMALSIAMAAWRWPMAVRLTMGMRRYLPAMKLRGTMLSHWPPGPLQLANWERHLHAWRLIGRAVVLVTLALGAAIGHGLAF